MKPADLTRAMQHLNDSLTRLVSEDDADRWVFRHGTVNQGFDYLQGDRQFARVQILLGHTEIENTVRYLGVDVEDALTLAKGIEI